MLIYIYVLWLSLYALIDDLRTIMTIQLIASHTHSHIHDQSDRTEQNDMVW